MPPVNLVAHVSPQQHREGKARAAEVGVSPGHPEPRGAQLETWHFITWARS